METVYNNGVPPVEAEVEAFGAGHAEVGGLVLAKWSFPDSLREAVALHHVAETSPDEAPKLAHVVCLADKLCHHLGVGTRSPKPGMVLADLPSVSVLGLSEKAVNEFAEAFPALYAEQRSMLE
jgi:HD-like signal output (HDOD) protein